MNKKIIYLMGCSGTGKSTLAKKLEDYDPKKYFRVIECSTRPPRPNEIPGYDYKFISDEIFDNMKVYNKFHQSVEYQFLPYRYGSTFDDMKDDKWNIVVVSIEGFLSGIENYGYCDSFLINIINDCELDVQREGRDPLYEEKINKAVLRIFAEKSNWKYIKSGFVQIPYFEIHLSKLKTLRDDKTKLLEYFEEILKR